MSKFNDKPFHIAFGEHLAKIRAKHNISRLQLAFEIETTEKQLRLIEAGAVKTGIKWAGRIAVVLNIPLAELFNFDMPEIVVTDHEEA